MKKRGIIYFGDPMCSWCWGFAPVIREIEGTFGHEAPLSIVLGGLHAFDTEPMSDTYKTTIRHHWEDVNKATGAAFDFTFFDREGFVLDTEPACRATVTVRTMDKSKVLVFYESVSHSFYLGNKDTTDVKNLKALASEVNLDPDVFEAQFESDYIKQMTLKDFGYSKQLGVSGFPTVLVKESNNGGGKLGLLSAGYQPYASLEPVIENWLSSGLQENPE